MPSDEVIIHLDGKEHSHWLNYRISSDLMIPSDQWQVKVGLPGSRPEYLRPWADIKVTMNDDPVLVGRIDKIATRTDKNNRELTLTGRDLMATLVDCAAPIYFALDLSLEDIVAKVVRPLGISKINVQAESAAMQTVVNKDTGKRSTSKRTRHKASVQPGMRAWDALKEACEAAGVWAWFEPDGTLVIGGPDYESEPVADLILMYDGLDNNLIDLRVEHDISKQYSQVTVLGQSAGGNSTGRVVVVSEDGTSSADAGSWQESKGQNAIQASVRDERLIKRGINRPLVEVEANCTQEEALRKAKKIMADGKMAALTITATVRGHRTDSGLLWAPGMRVNLISEPDWVNATFFLTAREFVGGEKTGQITELTLKPDKTWLPELAAQNKSRNNAGSGGSGRVIVVSQ